MVNFDKIRHIYCAHYQLFPKANLNAKSQLKPRNGALLRVEFADHGIGYADCYPWEELGDLSLAAQLELLAQKKVTPLTQRSLYFAEIDAKHRSENKSVFLGKELPCNHLHGSSPQDDGDNNKFQFVKLKFGMDLEKEIEFIEKYYDAIKEKNLKLRLDFNAAIPFEKSIQFFSKIKHKTDIIDFVEDPCEFNFEHWKCIQKQFSVSLAWDRKLNSSIFPENSKSAFQVLIVKPAIENAFHLVQKFPNQRIVFTSYMDHPLGQLCGLYEAATFYETFPEKEEHCGFLTHQLFEENFYSNLISTHDTIIFPKLDSGFGFGSLLEKEIWKKI